jgi:hypothetical protein
LRRYDEEFDDNDEDDPDTVRRCSFTLSNPR